MAVFALVLLKDGLTADNVTHVGILAFLVASVAALPSMRRGAQRGSPRTAFVAACCACAMVVEACYMISAPLHPSLVVARGMDAGAVLRNLAVDLGLTLPAYVVIFAIVWTLLRRYGYRALEMATVVSAGQALGDGMSFLAAQPAMLLFLPYLMLNYQAMTLVPFLALQDRLPPPAHPGSPARLVAPLVALPLAYGVVGTAVIAAGKALRLLP